MANKKDEGFILPLLALAGIGYLLYSSKSSGAITTREKAIQVIKHFNPGADLNTLQTGDLGYVIARAQAYQDAIPYFYFNGQRFVTSTGKAG